MSELFLTYNIVNEHFNNMEHFADEDNATDNVTDNTTNNVTDNTTNNVTDNTTNNVTDNTTNNAQPNVVITKPKPKPYIRRNTVITTNRLQPVNSTQPANKPKLTSDQIMKLLVGLVVLVVAILLVLYRTKKNILGLEKDRDSIFYTFIVLVTASVCSPCYIVYGLYKSIKNEY